MGVVWRLVSPMAARTAEQSPDLAPSPRHSMGDSFFRQARLGNLRVKGSNSNRFPYSRNLDHRKAFFSVNPVIPFIPGLIPVRNGPKPYTLDQDGRSAEKHFLASRKDPEVQKWMVWADKVLLLPLYSRHRS